MNQKLEILALCRFADYSSSGMFNLVAIFDQVTIQDLPGLMRGYVAFTISGNTPDTKPEVKIDITDPVGDIVASKSVNLIVSKTGKSNFFLELDGLPIKKLGSYLIKLRSGNKTLGSTSFTILKQSKANEK